MWEGEGGIHNPGRHRTVDGGQISEHPVMLRRTRGIVVLGGSDREVDGAHVIGVPVDRIKSERIKGNCDRGGNVPQAIVWQKESDKIKKSFNELKRCHAWPCDG